MVPTIKYEVVLFGSSRVGKKAFIHAAEMLFFRESLLASPSESDKRSNRLSINRNRLSMTFKTSPTSPPSNGTTTLSNIVLSTSPQQEAIENQVLALMAMNPELTGVPPNTIVLTSNGIRYEVHIVHYYDTGFTEEEQEQVVKADGYMIMIDLTNKFSVQRAKVFHKKLLQMKSQQTPNQKSGSYSSSHTGGTDVSSGEQQQQQQQQQQQTNKVPLILIGSKSDAERRQITTKDGIALGDSWNCPFFECSTLQAHNQGIASAMRQMVNVIDEKKKRQSLAFSNANSDAQSKRFSWRRSLNLSLGNTPSSHANLIDQMRAVDDLDGNTEMYKRSHRHSMSFSSLRAKILGSKSSAAASRSPEHHQSQSNKHLDVATDKNRRLSSPESPMTSTTTTTSSPSTKRRWFSKK